MNEENKRVLAVGAHPDDVEFMCSGALYLLRQRGWEISVCCVARGDCGSMTRSPEKIAEIRNREAIRAAGLLDASFYQLGESDLRVFFDDRTLMKLTECIRKVKPRIVFTHPHMDYMADHEAVSRLVRAACFAASVPNYTTRTASPQPPAAGIPCLYYWAPLEGRDIYGDFAEQRIWVNIKDAIDFKVRMLSCHESQRDWLMQQHHMDRYTQTMKNTAKAYGEMSGFGFAEGYTQHLGNAYPQENLLRVILGDLVKDGES
jgi:LmbE family N-acetylglucosaminyl deacetylase